MRKGFTLLELMVVLLILGILCSLSLVNYTRAVERSKVPEAEIVLSSLQIAQLNYEAEHYAYTVNMTDLAVKITQPAQWEYPVLFDQPEKLASMTRKAPMGYTLSIGSEGSAFCDPGQAQELLTDCRTYTGHN